MNRERPSLFQVLANVVRVLHRERPERLRALGAMVLIVSLIIVAVLASIANAPDTWQPVVEVVQGVVTILAVLVGGIWAFYVFVLGRARSASVQIQLRFKQVMCEDQDGGAVTDNRSVISVKLKNVGRTRVDTRRCKFMIEPITEEQIRNQPTLEPITNTMSGRNTKVFPFLETLIGLEPGEEYTADVLVPMGETLVFKVAVQFVGLVGPTPLPTNWRRLRVQDWRARLVELIDQRRREKTWGSRQILDVRLAPQATDVRMVE